MQHAMFEHAALASEVALCNGKGGLPTSSADEAAQTGHPVGSRLGEGALQVVTSCWPDATSSMLALALRRSGVHSTLAVTLPAAGCWSRQQPATPTASGTGEDGARLQVALLADSLACRRQRVGQMSSQARVMGLWPTQITLQHALQPHAACAVSRDGSHHTPAWALANPTPAHSAAVVFTAARIAAGAPLPGAPALVGAFAASSAPGLAGDGAGASPAMAEAEPPKKLKSGESGSGTCSRQVHHLSRSGLQGCLKGG